MAQPLIKTGTPSEGECVGSVEFTAVPLADHPLNQPASDQPVSGQSVSGHKGTPTTPPTFAVESFNQRPPKPGFSPLKAIDPQRGAGEPAYPVGTLLQAKERGFIADAEVVNIAWEKPNKEKAIVGYRHLYRLRVMKNGTAQILSESELAQYFDYYKLPDDYTRTGD